MWTDSVFNGRPATEPPWPADSAARIHRTWFPLEVRRWTLESLADTAVGASAAPAAAAPRDTSHLKIEGYKTIRVGVGGNGGVALDQTLLLDADGDLAPGIHLKARISDGNLPLSSQGSSAALRDVDELWIDVSSRTWGTRLGDQDWSLGPGLGAGFQRKLRGWSGSWRSDDDQASVVVGGPRARWAHLTISGVEGQQEGYVLVREATGLHGAVVPGSERVRINGEALRRGGDADYVVRYAQGLLDFTAKRRIHASDAIEVEFQAADLDYERTFAAAHAQGRSGGVSWESWAARETDAADLPLSYAADTSTRRILSTAGADTSLARDSAGRRIPLPRQVGEAGARLGIGDSSRWLRGDLRGAELDRNVLSGADPVVSGMFGAAEGGVRFGEPVDRGGSGRWRLGSRAEALQDGFQGLSSADTLGSGSDAWAGTAPAAGTGRRQGGASLDWEATPGLGAWTRAEARLQGPAFLSLGSARIGLDRGADHQALATGSWSRFDDGLPPLDRVRGQGRSSWTLGPFVPRAEADLELDDARTGDTASRRYSRWGALGSRWDGPLGWRLDGEGNLRTDATDRGGAVPGGVDTARTVGGKGSARWNGELASLDLGADWSSTRRRVSDAVPWTESGSWLGEATGSAAPFPGLRATARWRLSTSAYQPETAAYDTVPAGTGAFAWDSILREAVPSDRGDLRYIGTRLDTSRPAVRASVRSVGGEVEVVPGRLFRDLRGVLADLGTRLHGELSQTDSSGALSLLPSWRDADLSRCPQARSLLEISLWWTRGGNRLEGSWIRELTMGETNQGMRDREATQKLEWTTAPASRHALTLSGEHGEVRESEPGYARREERWRGEPSLALRPWTPLEVRPGWVEMLGSGEQSGTAFNSTLAEPYLACGLRLPHGLMLRADGRRASVDATGPVGSRVTDGFPAGTTWRASAGLEWAWKDHVQARADWTLRLEPDRPAFQKLSVEARANF